VKRRFWTIIIVVAVGITVVYVWAAFAQLSTLR
jgi:hypothetical protein